MFNLSEWLSKKAEDCMRSLLETKHLYQSVALDLASLQREAKDAHLADAKTLDSVIELALNSRWYVHDEISSQRPAYLADTEQLSVTSISLYIEFIKTSCLTCKQVLPFNLVRAMDLYEDLGRGWRVIRRPEHEQDFVFLFQCQSCRSAPDAFLVRRRAGKLTLSGRAPIERVDVPGYIPKEVAKYYSAATVAFQSGQTLAALFLLRVIIEQFTRQAVSGGEDLRADEVLDRYVMSLPSDFKSRFPSLREAYRELSKAIHAAEESVTVFEASRAAIARHFEARMLFEL